LDTITLKSLSYHSGHGYYDRERTEGNQFEVDVTAMGDFRKAIVNDSLSDTFDYEKAEEIVNRIMNGKSEKLIEKLCSRIGDELFIKLPSATQLFVTVRKLNPPLKTKAEFAEITMQWKR
jgi:7,8-dihydroneopterin aldolase/epimerase/oxygenase